jgi:hypothetical protein
VPVSKQLSLFFIQILLVSQLLKEVELDVVLLGSPPLQLQGFLIVPICVDEVSVKLPVIVEIFVDDVLESLELILFDVKHFELTIEDGVVHVIQHFGLELSDSLDDLALQSIDLLIVSSGRDSALLVECSLRYPQFLSLVKELPDAVGLGQFSNDVLDVW